MKPKPHIIRGVLATLVLGLPFLFFVINAAWIMLSEFVRGWIPSNWFSSNPADWIFGTGGVGEANAYLGFMVNVIPAVLLGSAIRWAFYGQRKSSRGKS
jgi:hypothetical protein